MTRLFRVLVLLILFLFANSAVFACTCLRDSVSKRFKRAKAVFIGQAAEPEDIPDDDSLIQGDGAETLRVIKSWKGVKKEFISVNLIFRKDAGMCFNFWLVPGKKYLIFAYGKELEVETACSDSYEFSDNPETRGYHIVQDSIKKLDNFYFRFWARIKPF